MKILLVEDDLSICEFLSGTLTAYRYTVDIATDGKLGLELALQGEYCVILLDVMLPRLDGLSICRQLRDHKCQTPILMLTAKDSAEDIVMGLDVGADDYVTKPCESSQLIARIRALSRRQVSAMSYSVLIWGNLCFDPNLIQVTYKQQLIALSPKEYSLLELFLRHPQRIFSRSNIIDHLWSIDESPTDAAVTNLIKDLRRKLKSAGMVEELIETVYRLGYRLKVALQKEKQKEAETKQQKPSDPEQEGLVLIEEATQDFQASLPERIKVLETAARSLQVDYFDSTQRERAKEEAHRLAGALGTFGYAKGSELARAIEHLFSDQSKLGEQQFTQFLQLLTQLQQEIAKPPVSPIIPSLPTVAIPLVLVIDDDDDHSFTESLCQAAPVRGLQVEVIAEESIALEQVASHPPSIILLSLNPASMPGKLTLLEKLKLHFPGIPVLTLAEQDCLDTRISIASLGSESYLLKSITTEEIFEAIAQFIPPTTPPSPRVMVVDDDPVQLKTLALMLQPWGLEVTSVGNPEQFWQVLTFTEPDLLLLDLEMPIFNGIELCRVVRQDLKYADLPIIIVTAHTGVDSIQQVFAAGADEFINKPIVGPELVTRVLSRIEGASRVQGARLTHMQQQLLRCQQQQLQISQREAKIDSLTQVATRYHCDEFLEREWQRLISKQTSLCLIICDIDHFQTYNDRYGYQAGNNCLQQVANTIRQCIDSSHHLVARSGGDEFMIVLSDTSLVGALQVVERIQQAIATLQIPHQSPSTNGYITLSLGITGSVTSQDNSHKDLIAIAKQALYTAKARGFNSYCLYSL
ncbi:MAG: response regulator [Pelatocladus maniniholoensis HA4357-MV3]|uniref:Response regulator n=1 Tax=Pelatocladus maniniholoensis HA4357-MV3 TaxID=1117104 RepID=A0A9E3H8F0_9NOST|nr:response regulator [Pelatocladus maniniholoensis HA4357-MV3]BAZ65619.1 multi-component transcriptional regulator, winged helix family protein [Fischerella sp. NIES-4106]